MFTPYDNHSVLPKREKKGGREEGRKGGMEASRYDVYSYTEYEYMLGEQGDRVCDVNVVG